RSLKPCVTLRAVMSEEPPGTKGTITVMGFCVGHSLAAAGTAATTPARQVAARANFLRLKSVLLSMKSCLRKCVIVNSSAVKCLSIFVCIVIVVNHVVARVSPHSGQDQARASL